MLRWQNRNPVENQKVEETQEEKECTDDIPSCSTNSDTPARKYKIWLQDSTISVG